MGLLFDKINKIITVQSPDAEITIQQLLNSIREWEDELSSMDIGTIGNAAGKEPLGGGVLVGITLTLLDDWRLAFQARSGPGYTQCKITGGNLVGTHVNGAIYPTAFTQIVITASSSATLQEQSELQYASFQNAVWVDVLSQNSGIEYPVGTAECPVNNLIDAKTIADSRGFYVIQIIGDITVNSGIIMNHFVIKGQNHMNSHVIVASAADVDNTEFREVFIEGTFDHSVYFKDCLIGNIDSFTGYISDCIFADDACVKVASNSSMYIMNCSSESRTSSTMLTIDLENVGTYTNIRGFFGRIKIINKTNNETCILDVDSGSIILENSVTNGTIVIRGNATVFNYSSADVIDETNLKKLDTIVDMEQGDWEIINNQMIFKNVDGSEAIRFNLYDKNGNPSMEKVYKRGKI